MASRTGRAVTTALFRTVTVLRGGSGVARLSKAFKITHTYLHTHKHPPTYTQD